MQIAKIIKISIDEIQILKGNRYAIPNSEWYNSKSLKVLKFKQNSQIYLQYFFEIIKIEKIIKK